VGASVTPFLFGMSSDQPATGTEEYAKDEIVLSYHGPLLYEAKVRDVDKSHERCYFVHYNGWNKNWDEWVGPDRLVKNNEAGLALAARLRAELEATKKGSSKKRKSGKKEADDDDDEKKAKPNGKKKKRKADEEEGVEHDPERAAKQEIKLTIPGQLKKKLVTDWECINRKKKLVKLPRDTTVLRILTDFLESKKSKKPEQQKVVKEVVDGLKVYFDRALGRTLLYRFERPQYEEMLTKLKEEKQDKDIHMSEIYGAEHLLRLIVRLPSLFQHTTMDESQVFILQKQISEFIKFLQRNPEYFAEPYEEPADLAAYSSKVEPPPSAPRPSP